MRVLVLADRADRTGAPTQLATLLPGLAAATDGDVVVLTRARDARLLDADGVRLVAPTPADRGLARLRDGGPGLFRPSADHLLTWSTRRRVGEPGVVYVNSLSSASLAEPFASYPTVVHVHEKGRIAAQYLDVATPVLARAHRVLAPSQATVDWLEGVGVARERVELLPGVVAASAYARPDPAAVEALQEQLSLDADERLVTSVGWVGPEKGSDRFLELARASTERTDVSTRWLWIGADDRTGATGRFRQQIGELGLSHRVSLLPPLDDLRPVLQLSDLLLLTSREETLSLVALESAAQATPVVYFPGSGGPDELAAEGVVLRPASDGVADVLELVIELVSSASARQRAGERAREAVSRRTTVAQAVDRLSSILQEAHRSVRSG